MFLLTLYPNLPFGKRWGKLSFSQNLSFRIDFGCLPSPGAILIHSFSICDFQRQNMSRWQQICIGLNGLLRLLVQILPQYL